MKTVDRLGSPLDLVAPARLGTSFRWFIASAWTSNLGDGIMAAAGPLLVAAQTREPFLVAMGSAVQMLPWLLFGLHAGVVADRFDRRRIMVVANLARSGVLVLLAASILTSRIDIWLLLLALFLLGTAETFVDATASTLLPMMVGREDLGVGNARLQFGHHTLNQLVGPPLGGLLFAAGMVWPVVGQALLVAVAAVLVSRIARTRSLPRSGESTFADIRAGIRWLWAHPAIRTLAITIVAFNVTFGAAWSVLVLVALDRLGLGEVGFGLLTATAALGGVVGTMLYGTLERRLGAANIMRIGLIVETALHLTLAVTTTPAVAFSVMFFFGIHEATWGTTYSTIRQRAVPDEFQGRVSSVYSVGLFGSFIVGSALGGVIAELGGLTAPFWFGFVGSALILAFIWRTLAAIAAAK